MSGEGGSQLPSSTSGQARPREGFLKQACRGLTTVNTAGNRQETWDINLTLFLFSIKTQTPRETQHMEWEKISLNHTSENRLTSIIYKELLQVNKNKAIKKSAKDLKGWVSRADTQTAQQVRRCSGHILGETKLKVSMYCLAPLRTNQERSEKCCGHMAAPGEADGDGQQGSRCVQSQGSLDRHRICRGCGYPTVAWSPGN